MYSRSHLWRTQALCALTRSRGAGGLILFMYAAPRAAKSHVPARGGLSGRGGGAAHAARVAMFCVHYITHLT